MGIGALRRYHKQAAEQASEPGDVEAAEDGQEIAETPSDPAAEGEAAGPVEGDNDAAPPPAGNASQEAWADWVLANVEGVDEAEVRAMKRDDLREMYGPDRPE